VFPIPQEHDHGRKLADHAASVLTGRSYVATTYATRAFADALDEVLTSWRPDVVHVDSLDLVQHLPRVAHLPIVVSHHNIESALLRRRGSAVGGVAGSYMRFQSKLVEREEAHWCSKIALNLVVSQEDEATLRAICPGARISLFPNGVDTASFTPSNQEPSGDIVFVGGYTWFPNSDGMDFFVKDILPKIHAVRPDTRVKWIGRAPENIRERFAQAGVELTGYVDDIRPYVHDARCYIVPLRIGGGTRLKILDAWALGKAVVSTSIGAEGIDAEDGANMLIRDDPDSFARAVLSVLEKPDLRRTLESAGRTTVEQTYEWNVLARQLMTDYAAVRPELELGPR
jgi:polysaccharide biosynthesis protein PslH